ncbi:MAG: DNA polymerase III subunit beta [Mycoplasmatales bacterium]
MKIKIKINDLQKILVILEKGLSSKVIIESLKGIKIDVKSNHIIFCASKSDLSIEYKLELTEEMEIFESGSVVVSGTQFISIIKKMNNEEFVELTKVENTLQIKTLNSKINLLLFDVSTYPTINTDNEGDLVELDKAIFSQIYNKAKYSTSSNAINIILSGINLQFKENEIVAASTDQRRLTYLTYPAIDNYENTLTISKYLFSDISKILELIDCQTLKLSNANNQFYFETKNLKVKGRVLDGKFPEAEKLIPADSSFRFKTSSARLLNTLEKIKLISDKTSSVVTVDFDQNAMIVKFFAYDLGSVEERVQFKDLSGDPFKIAFDPQYVIDAIHSIDSEDLKFNFVSETSPFLITAIDDETNKQVISPIRMG